MNLNALKAQRKGLRTAFSNCLKKIESELAQELCNFETLSVLKIQFNDKFARMDSCQNAILETLLLSDDGEHLFAEDLEDAEIYREKFWELTTKIELKSQQCTVPSDKESRKFKLPKIELKSSMERRKSDRSTERKIWTRRLISTNLRSRPVKFGYENAVTGRAKTDLPLLYDELESKLRSLESLGKTQDKYGDFLTPLVESCLPEEVLVAWERSRNYQTESEGSRSLGQLMNFLRQEINKVETTTAAALVNMDNPGQEKLIRAVIDSGSQSTYVSENVITHLKALPLRSETVIHALFGGSETKPKKHDIFPVEVSNLNKTYTCSFEALSEKMICGYIPKIEDKQVLNELKRKKIKFTDSFRRETEINLLIGADVLGKLLTGNSVELESGLTAVETKLGWTVFGKGSCVKDNIVTTLSMHSMNIPVNKLWELDVLGISSPTEIEKQKTLNLA
ncbi:DUF1758 domain-containing protein [Trichonephila clavipes]|nr:DUF1758 domain-containing protein [Trichonephila clavipes]